jgi:hypothetical protein
MKVANEEARKHHAFTKVSGRTGHFRSWGLTGCTIGLSATATLDPKQESQLDPARWLDFPLRS